MLFKFFYDNAAAGLFASISVTALVTPFMARQFAQSPDTWKTNPSSTHTFFDTPQRAREVLLAHHSALVILRHCFAEVRGIEDKTSWVFTPAMSGYEAPAGPVAVPVAVPVAPVADGTSPVTGVLTVADPVVGAVELLFTTISA